MYRRVVLLVAVLVAAALIFGTLSAVAAANKRAGLSVVWVLLTVGSAIGAIAEIVRVSG